MATTDHSNDDRVLKTSAETSVYHDPDDPCGHVDRAKNRRVVSREQYPDLRPCPHCFDRERVTEQRRQSMLEANRVGEDLFGIRCPEGHGLDDLQAAEGVCKTCGETYPLDECEDVLSSTESDLRRLSDALERVDWRDVDGVSTATAATFAQRVREALERGP